jgi:hypothetical protein
LQIGDLVPLRIAHYSVFVKNFFLFSLYIFHLF